MLAAFYEPDLDAETRAGLRQEFLRVLEPYPTWACQRAIDAWLRESKRRPSPAELLALTRKQVEPMTTELRRREPEPPREERVSPERAAAILSEAGFRPKRMTQVDA